MKNLLLVLSILLSLASNAADVKSAINRDGLSQYTAKVILEKEGEALKMARLEARKSCIEEGYLIEECKIILEETAKIKKAVYKEKFSSIIGFARFFIPEGDSRNFNRVVKDFFKVTVVVVAE